MLQRDDGVMSEAERQRLLQNLRRTNLDLLPVLHELLRHRNLTAVARVLGVSQPAVSKSLRDLRVIFDDELLVALGRDAQLTPRAQALVEPLSRILIDLGGLLTPVQDFDPSTEPLHLLIRTADYVSVILAPILMRICAEEAPQVDIHFVDSALGNLDHLDALDFMIVPRPLEAVYGKTLGRLALWRDEMTCIVPTRDDRWGESISADEFRRSRHVAYEPSGYRNVTRSTLLQPTASLEVAPVCEAPDFLVLGAIVEETDCIALVPRRLAEVVRRGRDIRIVPIDFPDRQLDIDAFWTARAGAKRGHAWAQNLLARAAATLEPI